MRVVVIGAGGLLGTAFQIAARDQPDVSDLVLPSRRDLDVTDEVEVERYLSATRPDAVVNAAALLPADLCDSHPQRAYAVHALGARWVARACDRIGALVATVSTDFVFDGAAGTAYGPDAPTRPLQTYGVTKLAGEHETRLATPRHLILRTAGRFGPAPSSPRARPCFVSRILQRATTGRPIEVVDSIVMSPTYTVDLARMTFALAFEDAVVGTYHVVNRGKASWYELAAAAARLAGSSSPVTPAAAPGFHVAAPRPTHTPLTGELPAHAAALQRPWAEALAEYVDRYWRAGDADFAHSGAARRGL
jgi:dTDP-4-dehydrorhamnose reductase